MNKTYFFYKIGIFLTAIMLCIFPINLIAASDVMRIEVDVIDSGSQEPGQPGSISIEVPDLIDLGDVDEDGNSDELKIYVNNTGEVAITVTPQLVDYSDDIFSNLYFREFKTSGGQPVEPKRIGSWSFNISAPASGATQRSKYFYMRLDLKDADIDLSSDLNGHRADVKFIATAQ